MVPNPTPQFRIRVAGEENGSSRGTVGMPRRPSGFPVPAVLEWAHTNGDRLSRLRRVTHEERLDPGNNVGYSQKECTIVTTCRGLREYPAALRGRRERDDRVRGDSMDLTGKRVMVVGGAGLIGSHLELVQRPHQVPQDGTRASQAQVARVGSVCQSGFSR